MARETRSGGVPLPSRIYHSTPPLRQAQFRVKRKSIRRLDCSSGELSTAEALRQQTLTQLDFVSSSADCDPVRFSDSEEYDMVAAGKENRRPKIEVDETKPSSSERKRSRKTTYGKRADSKRRRTLGDVTSQQLKEEDNGGDDDLEGEVLGKYKRGSNRRKTTGDTSDGNTSAYHTQTLTQFLGRDHMPAVILDSEDEDLLHEDKFNAWMGGPGASDPQQQDSPASVKRTRRRKQVLSTDQPLPADVSRQESVVPQTPTKPTRTEIPSSSQQVTPVSAMVERYGAPNDGQESPSTARRLRTAATGPTPVSSTPLRRKLVVEDSTESAELQASLNTASPASTNLDRPPQGNNSAGAPTRIVSSTPAEPQSTPTRPKTRSSQELCKSTVKVVRISFPSSSKKVPKEDPGFAHGRTEIADSEEEDDDDGVDDLVDDATTDAATKASKELEADDGFGVGADTQFALDQLVSSSEALKEQKKLTGERAPSSQEAAGPGTTSGESASSSRTPRDQTPLRKLRKPLARPLPLPVSTQFFESQRIPAALLQEFPQPQQGTDVMIPLSTAEQSLIADGYRTSITLSFRIPQDVVRAWLWDGELMCYGVSMTKGEKQSSTSWEHDIPQVYELNDPWDKDAFVREDILVKFPRFQYVPPAIASRLLWNLQRALFSEDGRGCPDSSLDRHEEARGAERVARAIKENDGDEIGMGSRAQASQAKRGTPAPGITVSQEVERQLHSDFAHSTQFPDDVLVPSTPDDGDENNGDEGEREWRSALIRPSQATTASQASSPSQSPLLVPTSPTSANGKSTVLTLPLPPQPPSQYCPAVDNSSVPGLQASSSIIYYQHYSDPSSANMSFLAHFQPSSSQLLSRSQQLPESLIREEEGGQEAHGD